MSPKAVVDQRLVAVRLDLLGPAASRPERLSDDADAAPRMVVDEALNDRDDPRRVPSLHAQVEERDRAVGEAERQPHRVELRLGHRRSGRLAGVEARRGRSCVIRSTYSSASS